MPAAVPPTALAISIQQTIDLLDSDFAELAEGVAESRYAFWLGSGISRERVDDLKPVIARVIAYLPDRIDPSAANCRFRVALDGSSGGCANLAQKAVRPVRCSAPETLTRRRLRYSLRSIYQ